MIYVVDRIIRINTINRMHTIKYNIIIIVYLMKV